MRLTVLVIFCSFSLFYAPFLMHTFFPPPHSLSWMLIGQVAVAAVGGEILAAITVMIILFIAFLIDRRSHGG